MSVVATARSAISAVPTASVAVTGREVDQPGLGDLLSRTVTSLRELPPKPPGGNDQG